MDYGNTKITQYALTVSTLFQNVEVGYNTEEERLVKCSESPQEQDDDDGEKIM